MASRISRLIRRSRSANNDDVTERAPATTLCFEANDTQYKHTDRMMLPRSMSMGDADDHTQHVKIPSDSQDPIELDRVNLAVEELQAPVECDGKVRNDNGCVDESFNVQEQLRALTQTVRQLAEMASMSPEEYQSKLLDNQLPHTDEATLPKSTALAITKLSQSIHRLHSSVDVLTQENDHQTAEITTLRAQVQEHHSQQSALSKLHAGNVKLRRRITRKDEIIAKLKAHIDERRHNQDGFLQLAQQVQHHEQLMAHAVAGNRGRTDTGGSSAGEFSDIEGLHDACSVSTSSSFITDDGIATIKLHRDRALTWPKPGSNDSSSSITSDLEISPITPMKKMLGSSKIANFLGSKQGQLYKLAMKTPVNLQFAKIPLDAEGSDFAFAVCGFEGFDADDSMRPTNGARLLQIDGKNVHGSWSIEELQSALEVTGTTVRLQFRNDEWNVFQKGVLKEQTQEFKGKTQKKTEPQNNDAEKENEAKEGAENEASEAQGDKAKAENEATHSPMREPDASIPITSRVRAHSLDQPVASMKQPGKLLNFLNFQHHGSVPEIGVVDVMDNDVTKSPMTAPPTLNGMISRLKMNHVSPKMPTRTRSGPVFETTSKLEAMPQPPPDGPVLITKPTQPSIPVTEPSQSQAPHEQSLSNMKNAMSKNMGKLFAFR